MKNKSYNLLMLLHDMVWIGTIYKVFVAYREGFCEERHRSERVVLYELKTV